MHRQIFSIVICAVLLAGCGDPASTPAPTVQQNSAPTAAVAATSSQIIPTSGPREYGTEEVQLPQAGTIIPPATEDPEVGKLFDTVILRRTGGITGKELNIVLKSDGTLTRDDVASTVPADQVKEISDLLDQIGFFGLQGIFEAPGTSADLYTYDLTAERHGSSRTITAQESLTPPQLANILQILSQLGSIP